MAQQSRDEQSSKEGLREQKKRKTRLRIAEVGLKLFFEHGYEGTTLDTIAEAAGISRRTFFAYFKSKEDIVLVLQAAAWESLLGELLKTSPDQGPLDAVYTLLVKSITPYDSPEVRAIDHMIRASETLMARKQAAYILQEEALYATLCAVWKQAEHRPSLRIVAMVSVGAMRLALEAWGKQSGNRSVKSFLKDIFAHLKSEVLT